MKLLYRYLRKRGYRVLLKDLRTDIELFRRKLGEKTLLDEWEGRLFNPDGEPRDHMFRYGSAYCPECRAYKNYDKECPYCGFHEMTP